MQYNRNKDLLNKDRNLNDEGQFDFLVVMIKFYRKYTTAHINYPQKIMFNFRKWEQIY